MRAACFTSSILLVVAVGCGGGGGGGAPGSLSCAYRAPDSGAAGLPDGAFCAEYSGDVIPSECPAAGGYVMVSECPTSGRVGRCDIDTSTSAGTVHSVLYSYAPITVEIAMMSCTTAGGTFTAL